MGLSASSARQAAVARPDDSPPEPPRGNPATLALRFKEAQREAAKKLKASTPHDTRMKVFGLLKQAKKGDIKGERPDDSRKVDQDKHDSWTKCKGMSKEGAMEAYVRSVAAM